MTKKVVVSIILVSSFSVTCLFLDIIYLVPLHEGRPNSVLAQVGGASYSKYNKHQLDAPPPLASETGLPAIKKGLVQQPLSSDSALVTIGLTSVPLF